MRLPKNTASQLLQIASLLCITAWGMSLSQIASAEEFYRWTDSKGVVHYTDKPPHGVKAEKIKRKTRSRQVDEDESTSSAASSQSDQAKKRCEEEKQRLAVLQNNNRVRMQDADGTVRDLSPEEIQREIALVNDSIKFYCQ